MSKYKIYYINLENSIKRKKFMEKQLIDLSLNYTRINAVNGKLIEERNKYKGNIDGYNYNINVKKYFVNSQIGCLFSHIKCFDKIIEDNNDIGIIIEDDMSFKHINKWNESLDEIIKNAPDDWDIIKLHSSCIKTINFLLKNYKKNGIKYINNKIIQNNKLENSSTGIYVVNKNFINKFRKKYLGTNNTYNITSYALAADILLYFDFTVYNYTIPLFVSNGFSSIIMQKINPYDVKSNNLVNYYYEKCV